MGLLDDNLIFAKLTSLAECLCATIITEGLPEPCFCGVVPGDIVALDYINGCDDKCGMAWVRLALASPTTGVGVVDEQVNNCGSTVGFTTEVGIARCLPVNEDGTPPDVADYLASAQLQIADMLAMRKAIECCEDLGDLILDSYQPLGPSGMAVGGFWLATMTME